MKNIVAIFLLFLISYSTKAQSNIKDSSINHFMVSGSFGLHTPGGNMKKDFGLSSAIGISFDYKLKSQFSFGIDGTFIFGNRIKDLSMLDALRTSQGDIIDSDGNISNILYYERGFTVCFSTSYLLTWKKPNPNSGVYFKLNYGFLQHKVRIEHNNNSIPALEGEYVKGYDRLTNGFMITEFVGYRYLSNTRLLNFFAGFEFSQGFTKNRRDYNYNLMGPDNTKRIDLFNGIRFGWILPLYKQAPQEYYFN